MSNIHLEICGSEDKPLKNTGAKEQCFEGVLERILVAKRGFSFENLDGFKSAAAWKAAIKNKDVVPLYSAYEVAPENTEPTFFESGNFKYKTKKEVKKTSFESYLSFCSHAALKGYANSEYTQVFELTETGVVLGVNTADDRIKGQDVTLDVGMRLIQTAAKTPTTKVSITYKDYEELENNAVAIHFPEDAKHVLDGIYDVTLTQVSAKATEIKFKAFSGCSGGGSSVNSLKTGDIVVKNATGVVQTVTFVEADSEGIYTITGTSLATGFTVALTGVIEQASIMYESPEPLCIKVV